MSDPTRLEEIRARVEQASNGPWHIGPYYQTDVESGGGRIAEVGRLGAPQAIADSAFIAHAREDIPYLLDLLASQEAAHAQLQEDSGDLIDALRTKADYYSGLLEQTEAELSTLRSQLQGLRDFCRTSSQIARMNSDSGALPIMDRRQCFGVSQAYENCADQLDQILTSLNDLKGVEGDGP